jgi:hypothetical protein
MTSLKDKVQNALDEARMLILGMEVLLGFQFRAVFQPGFEKLPITLRYTQLIALCLLLMVLGLLLTPGSFHRIVARGEDTDQLHRTTTRVMDIALLPFSLALGLQIFSSTSGLLGLGPSLAVGGGAFLVAGGFWYGWELLAEKHPQEEEQMAAGETELKDKIKQVLTEARVMLPGAQALLGFQLIIFLMEGFQVLPGGLKYVHLVSLLLVALAVILLMTPAAYHRMVEKGENSEHFHRIAGRLLIAAMIPFALGVSGDFYLVIQKVSNSTALGLLGGCCSLGMMAFLWFVYPISARSAS